MLLAIPSNAPGGLEAATSDHFGHCDAFTLVTLDQDTVTSVQILPNAGHAQGGCMAPVMLLKNQGVEAMLAGGMGPRPLAGFQQVGITVYYNEGAPTVGEAVELVAQGRARAFGPAQVCGGGGGNGGGCGGHEHA
ncbi:MAG: NifB/NifX family molybdenum-iron cluster-binding protein [bacterium]